MVKHQANPAPTVIVSGGANVRIFLDNPLIQMLIRAAKRIFIAAEREKDGATQAKTDAAHEKQAQRVEEITGIRPTIWQPAEDKDLADMNARLQMLQSVQLMSPMMNPNQQAGTKRSQVMDSDFI